MPQNKNAFLRYKILDRCFSGSVRYSIDELLDFVNDELEAQGEYGISLRQLRDDIKNMRSVYDAPIEARPNWGRKCYYAYADEEYSIFKSGISDEDYNALRSTLEMLAKYKVTNVWLEDVITNLECRFDIVPNTEKLVFFDENRNLKGLELLGDIIKHTVAHEAIDVVYRSYRGHEETYCFHPYCVKQYNGRWFVLGYGSSHDKTFNFALDRICSFKKSDTAFVENEFFDIDEYYKDIIGVTQPDDRFPDAIDVQLKFDPKRFPYVVSKPLHSSQRVVNEQECIVEIRVKKNRELKQCIYSYMPNVEVLSPEFLRKEIVTEIKRNLEKYNS